MVKPPTLVQGDRCGREQVRNSLSERRIAWSGVLNLVEFLREPAEIMNRTWMRHRSYCGLRNKPMGRDAENRFWLLDRFPDGSPCRGIHVLLKCVQRIAMSEEYRRKSRRHSRNSMRLGGDTKSRHAELALVIDLGRRIDPNRGGVRWQINRTIDDDWA